MVATVYVNAGQNFVADVIDGTTNATDQDYRIAWGTGGSSTGGTATDADTALEAEATEVRATTVTSQPSTDTNQWVGTLTAGTAKTIEEAGLFTTATGGTMIIRGSHGGITLATDDSIQYTITLQQNN